MHIGVGMFAVVVAVLFQDPELASLRCAKHPIECHERHALLRVTTAHVRMHARKPHLYERLAGCFVRQGPLLFIPQHGAKSGPLLVYCECLPRGFDPAALEVMIWQL